MWALDELLQREPTGLQPKIELICEPKDFYDHRWEDFKIKGLGGITPLSKKLEIAIQNININLLVIIVLCIFKQNI